MTVLIGLFVAIAAISGLLTRLVVPGARDLPLPHSLLLGAAVTAAAGFGCWFVATPVVDVLATPLASTVPMVGVLAVVAGWRSRSVPADQYIG
ncbi:hypothetical protein [Nakamurella deserti]|uniref:hypothetical protein n=1 Tax=Nakamurella deserti TaxID=2164074 RepID=UPI000DBE28E1|nr:hypothetical protein [Nakamurella deserti]